MKNIERISSYLCRSGFPGPGCCAAYSLFLFGYVMEKEYFLELNRGQVARVDKNGYEKARHLNWRAQYYPKLNQFYAVRGKMIDGKFVLTFLHRFLMDAPDGMVVDHINHDTLDCRFENMRLCSHSENMRNRKSTRKSSSRYLGVSLCKRTNRWLARIKSNGQERYLGYYKSEINAAKAYDKAAKEIHGEFANLNFPESETV